MADMNMDRPTLRVYVVIILFSLSTVDSSTSGTIFLKRDKYFSPHEGNLLVLVRNRRV